MRVSLMAALVTVGLVAGGAMTANAAPPSPSSFGRPGWGDQSKAYVPQALLDAIHASPGAKFAVIVQSKSDRPSTALAGDVRSAENATPGAERGVRRSYSSLSAVSAELTGWQILLLQRRSDIVAITPDAPVDPVMPSGGAPTGEYKNAEMWRQSVNIASLAGGPQAPTVAIVDSGIDTTKTGDFGNRIVASVSLSSRAPGAAGDQEGHGTMVAGIVGGNAPGHPGAAPGARLIDVHTANAKGQSSTGDIIAACDWILQHKDQYGIRVVNFSLVSTPSTSFVVDPVDRAVEQLWFAGVVVVAAAGNYGDDGSAVDMSHAPGNDPFVLTVGAVDQNQTPSTADDTAAPWSAFGHTKDGFAKPEVSAPGRYLIMPVPAGAYIPGLEPGRIVAPGYMWMSGTSFAAPIVSGAAAQILARNPGWTPDQVKGALMLTAHFLPKAAFAAGVGEIDAAAAAAVGTPPDPNKSLSGFIGTDSRTGLPQFDAKSWLSTIRSSASWSSASWSSASWSSASWSSASWSSASWSSASWSSASWSSSSEDASTLDG